MHLTYRPALVPDIEHCLEMLPPEFEYSPLGLTEFAHLWQEWLRAGTMQMAVIEDGSRPVESRLVAFGNSVFVTDTFAEEAKTVLAPYLSAQIIQRCIDERTPLLSLNAVRAANSGTGLTLMVLHVGWRASLSVDEMRWVKGKLLEALLFTHGGYRLKEMMQEIYSAEERQRGIAAGALVKNDYAAYYHAHPEAVPTPERHPYLIGGCRSEISDGSYLSPLFFYSPPRFFFKIGEQEVLRLALLDRSDLEIAQSLNLSPSAVQKRWRTVYERVATIQPDFFPAALAPSSAAATRGTEKRRHLLGYLRVHLEELRPVSLAK